MVLENLLHLAVKARAGEGRREVIDDDGGISALRLRAFAGVIDDEGINQRGGP